ncbi:hypothetical protein DFJ73DRAFT_968185 [Zopfochytrium polystomum]|nr:hypothetical protein DFJ73DRAFT_968185 [Zopfochytrium polystomum]
MPSPLIALTADISPREPTALSVAGIKLLLIVIALIGTGTHPVTGALVETVGGVTVQVGPRLEADHNTSADVHKASTDGQTDNAVYKKIRGGAPFGRHEVAATRAAGQLISAEGNRMIQHKTAYQRVNVIPATTTGKPKPKMSDHIYNQVLAHQRKTGYNHNDVHADNIRVTPQKQSGRNSS